MGTHPIFESNFDCLTEWNRRNVKMEKNVARVAPMTQMATQSPPPAASRGSLMPSRRKRKAQQVSTASPPAQNVEPLDTKALTAPREVMSNYNRGGIKPRQQHVAKKTDNTSFLKDAERLPVSPCKTMTFTVVNDRAEKDSEKGKQKKGPNRNSAQIDKQKEKNSKRLRSAAKSPPPSSRIKERLGRQQRGRKRSPPKRKRSRTPPRKKSSDKPVVVDLTNSTKVIDSPPRDPRKKPANPFRKRSPSPSPPQSSSPPPQEVISNPERYDLSPSPPIPPKPPTPPTGRPIISALQLLQSARRDTPKVFDYGGHSIQQQPVTVVDYITSPAPRNTLPIVNQQNHRKVVDYSAHVENVGMDISPDSSPKSSPKAKNRKIVDYGVQRKINETVTVAHVAAVVSKSTGEAGKWGGMVMTPTPVPKPRTSLDKAKEVAEKIGDKITTRTSPALQKSASLGRAQAVASKIGFKITSPAKLSLSGTGKIKGPVAAAKPLEKLDITERSAAEADRVAAHAKEQALLNSPPKSRRRSRKRSRSRERKRSRDRKRSRSRSPRRRRNRSHRRSRTRSRSRSKPREKQPKPTPPPQDRVTSKWDDFNEVSDEEDDLIGMQSVKDTDLFARPGRLCRPNRLAIIIRGLPGSGKSMVARNIEKTERKYGKKTKVFAWDEYFKENEDDDPTGIDDYNFDDPDTPEYYKHYLNSFQLAVKKNQFDVIILDAVNAKTEEYKPFYQFAAKATNWTAYVMTVSTRDDVMVYALRQDLKRSIDHCKAFSNEWQSTPPEMTRLECGWLWKTDFDVKSTTQTTMEEAATPHKPISFTISADKDGSNNLDSVKSQRDSTPPPQMPVTAPIVLPRLPSPPPRARMRVPPALPVSPSIATYSQRQARVAVYTPQPVLPTRQLPQHSSRETPSVTTLAPPSVPPPQVTEHQNFEPIATRPTTVPESVEQAHAAQTMHRATPGEKYARYRGQAGLPKNKATSKIQAISSISEFTSRDD